MTKIIPFAFDGNPVRAVVLDGEPHLVGKDVAERLGYADAANAIKQHRKGVVKRHPLQTDGGMQKVRVLSEPDVLRLIVSRKLPAAERFERWVFEEVLPSVRKTGAYVVPGARMAGLSEGDRKIIGGIIKAVMRDQVEPLRVELQQARAQTAALATQMQTMVVEHDQRVVAGASARS